MTQARTEAGGAPAVVDLREDELPASIRKKFVLRDEPQTKGHYFLVRAETAGEGRILKRTVKEAPRLARLRAEKVSEDNIEAMLALLLDPMERAPVDADLEADNAELRAHYIKSTPMLQSADIHRLAAARSANKSETASRWKREGRIFAVRVKGADLYPAFQFAEGEPLPAIRKALAALPESMTPWQIALWFASGNGWLDGKAPQDALDAPAAVVEAARRAGEPAVG